MRYFIAHLPKGSIEKYHHELVKDVTGRFQLQTSAGYFPTHITIKAPFETSDITAVKNVLNNFTAEYHSLPFTIRNFGHFDKNVIFLDIVLPEQTSLIVKHLQNELKKIPDLVWGAHEPLDRFHITLAKKEVAEKFDTIWKYLEEKGAPHFDLLFDNVSLLRKENDIWIVDSFYPIN